jgi:hypothetical protein
MFREGHKRARIFTAKNALGGSAEKAFLFFEIKRFMKILSSNLGGIKARDFYAALIFTEYSEPRPSRKTSASLIKTGRLSHAPPPHIPNRIMRSKDFAGRRADPLRLLCVLQKKGRRTASRTYSRSPCDDLRRHSVSSDERARGRRRRLKSDPLCRSQLGASIDL